MRTRIPESRKNERQKRDDDVITADDVRIQRARGNTAKRQVHSRVCIIYDTRGQRLVRTKEFRAGMFVASCVLFRKDNARSLSTTPVIAANIIVTSFIKQNVYSRSLLSLLLRLNERMPRSPS